jgi:hypothetical protein
VGFVDAERVVQILAAKRDGGEGSCEGNSKTQNPKPKKTTKSKSQKGPLKYPDLEFAIWDFLGIWILGFGIYLGTTHLNFGTLKN